MIRGLTDLNVGFLCGEMGVDFWSRDHWRNWLALHECIVLTPQLLLDALRHGFVAVRAWWGTIHLGSQAWAVHSTSATAAIGHERVPGRILGGND